MACTVALGDDHFDRLADHLGLGELEQCRRRAVPGADPALGVAGDDGVDRRFHDRAELRLRFAQGHAHLGNRHLALDPGQHLARIEGLEDQVVPRFESLDPRLGVVEPGHEDHRDVTGEMALLELGEQVEGIGLSKMNVQQHQVGLIRDDGFEDVAAAGRHVDCIAVLFQELLQGPGAGGVVVDDQDESAFGQGRSSLCPSSNGSVDA
jgi:hypothetical protein